MTSNVETRVNKIGLLRLVGYGSGSAAAGLSAILGPMLLLYFLTEYVHLAPWLAGVILAAPKLWDVLVDVPIGRTSDQVAARLGSHLRLGIWSGLGLALLLPLTFVHPSIASKPVLVGFYILVQVAQASLYTIFGVVNLALTVELADGEVERNKLLTMGNLGGNLAAIVLVVCAPTLIHFGGDGARGYVNATFMVAAIMLVMYAIYYFALRKSPHRSEPLAEASLTLSLRAGLLSLWRNKPFLMIVVVIVALGTSTGCVNSLVAYLNEYLLGRRPEDLVLLAAPLLVGGLIGLPLAVPVLKRLGNGGTLRHGVTALIVAFVIFWAGLAWASSTLLIAGGTLYGIVGAVFGVGMMSAGIEAARADPDGAPLGLYLGMVMSALKIGASLGAMASGVLLSAIGYQADAPPSAALRHGFAVISLAGPLAMLLVASAAMWIYHYYAVSTTSGASPAQPYSDPV
jgi:GPH family glycoside/pentoside/hexuronide:cation symporter